MSAPTHTPSRGPTSRSTSTRRIRRGFYRALGLRPSRGLRYDGPIRQSSEGKGMSKRTIAVVGATGAQGGGLVRAILADPSGGFAARAISRDDSGEKAKALAAKGAEVVKASVDDAASLRRAFDG